MWSPEPRRGLAAVLTTAALAAGTGTAIGLALHSNGSESPASKDGAETLAVSALAPRATTSDARRSDPLARLTPAQLAGLRTVFPLEGTSVPAWLVRRIRRGEAGSVILFSRNVESRAQVRRLVGRLQAVPRPEVLDAPLLVMVDQEGGLVRRLPVPPTRSAAEMGEGSPAGTRAAGRAAGSALRSLGVNVDLAPVADVPRAGSFLVSQQRVFADNAAGVARYATAFAQGLADRRVAATAKHFPGLGAATTNTDVRPTRIESSARELRRVDMRPFRSLIDTGVPMVMTATAVYPKLGARPAALAPRVVRTELRGRLGFDGVIVTDALDTPALAPFGGAGPAARLAAAAGNDLMLLAGGKDVADEAADAMARALRRSPAARERARESVSRVLRLRERLAGGVSPRQRPPLGRGDRATR